MNGRTGPAAASGIRTTLAAALALLATACAPLSVAPRPAPPPSAPSGASGQDRGGASSDAGSAEVESQGSAPRAPRPTAASTTLLEQSRSERSAGNHAAAVATLERALRIDPNNAALWIEVGEVELERGNAAQAASMARKALTLTAGDAALTRRAERLLDAAARAAR